MAPEGTITAGRHLRFAAGHRMPGSLNRAGSGIMLQNIETSGSASAPIDIEAHFILPDNNPDSSKWYIAGNKKLLSWDGASFTDVTPSGGLSTSSDYDNPWTGCVFGGVPILNNGVDPPLALLSTVFEPLDWDGADDWGDKGWTARAMRQYGNVLVALGYSDGSASYNQTVLWSALADPNTTPPTWDPTDLSQIAAWQPLATNSGRLLDGAQLGQDFIVYAQDCSYRMTFQPENYQQPMAFENLSFTEGLMAVGCVAQLDGYHVCLGNTDLYRTDGRQIVSIASDRVRSQIMASISPVYYDRCRVARVASLNEIWFLIPSSASADGEIDTIWTWNYTTDSWSNRVPPPGLRFATAGVRPSSWGAEDWDSDEEAWGLDTTTWNESPFAPGLQVPGGVCDPYGDYGETVVQLDGAYSTVLGEEHPTSFAERTGIIMGEGQGGSSMQRGFINEVVLVAEGVPIEVQIGASETMDGPYSWSSAFTWTPGVTRRIPFRSPSGLYFGYRLTFTSEGAGSVSEIIMNYQPIGGR
jgi:hypothetical protein